MIDPCEKQLMMDRIMLFESRSETLSVTMSLYFDQKDRLFFDGCDMGPWVEERTGDYDFEYQYTIEGEGLTRLFSILNLELNDRKGLLAELGKRFSGPFAYSEFGRFMTENEVKFKSFTF